MAKDAPTVTFEAPRGSGDGVTVQPASGGMVELSYTDCDETLITTPAAAAEIIAAFQAVSAVLASLRQHEQMRS